MANPRVELIAQNIVTTLEGVTTGNGYQQTLSVSRRSLNRSATPIANGTTIVSMTSATPTEPQVHNKKQWVQQFQITYYSTADEDDTTPADQTLLKAASDIFKALRVDSKRGTASSGDPLAIDTDINGYDIDIDENGAWDAITVIVDVLYRHNEDDPYMGG